MTKRSLRNQLGYGSTYRKGGRTDVGAMGEISSVLGGQVWLIKPDKDAKSANPCIWMQAGVVKNKDCNNYYDCTSCKYGASSIEAVGTRSRWMRVRVRHRTTRRPRR